MKLSINKLAFIAVTSLTMQNVAYAQNQMVTIDPATSETTVVRSDAIASTPKEDAMITNSLKSLIGKSSTLSKLKVNVQTNQGVVVLSGEVDSDSHASTLVELAQSIVGVRDVDASNLKVKDSTQPFTDMLITAKIRGLFIREKVFGGKDIAALNIGIETNNGIVYLTGTIDNQQQLQNAINIIKGVQGVKKVEYLMNKVVPNASNNRTNTATINTNGTTTIDGTSTSGSINTTNSSTKTNTNTGTSY